MSAKLVTRVYATMLRTAKDLDAAIAARGVCGVKEIGRVAAVTGASPSTDPVPTTLYDFVRSEVRTATERCAKNHDDYFEAALMTIKQMNRRCTSLNSDDWMPKPSNVEFSVGEILQHEEGFRVVVVGWDASCTAGDAWLAAHGMDSKEGGDQPFYRCFVDTSEGHAAATVYVAQESLTKDVSGPIKHPQLGRYFERYYDSRYVPRSDMQVRYPEDTVRVPPIHAPGGTMDWATLSIVEVAPQVDIDVELHSARSSIAE